MNVSSLSKLPSIHHINWRLCFRMIGHVTNAECEYSEVPLYPPIEKVSWEMKWRKKKTDWHAKIEKLPTVEQKLIELNMPKYYGYWSVILKDETLRPEQLEFLKFATRTEVIKNFPEHYYGEQEMRVQKAVNCIRNPVKDLILLHLNNEIFRECKYKRLSMNKLKIDRIQNQNFIIDLNNLLMKYLNDDISHLSPTSVDLRPRIEGFWWVGGFEPVKLVKAFRSLREVSKPFADDPVDRAMRSSICPTLVLRTGEGLPEVVPLNATGEHLIQTSNDVTKVERPAVQDSKLGSISPYETDPKCWGFVCRRKHAVIVPGFWPGEKDEYGHIFFNSREFVNQVVRKYGDYAESLVPLMLQLKAVLAGFTQTLSYALYQGFTPVNEMTYPIVQQSIFTDGLKWQFGLYQLNTCCLHSHLSTNNPRTNFLWLSDDLNLFEGIEGDSVKGLNEDVLKLLCSMYLKKGQPRRNPHPYLSDYKYLMHHNAPEEYKEEFQKYLHHTLSERPRHFLKPEILPWEYIYKIYFNTRPFDRKFKFFENQWTMNPYTRRLDEYKLPRIPKVRRITLRIRHKPRINSEHLFKHDWKTLQSVPKLYSDDEVAFKTMNIRKDTPPYFKGLLWSRGMTNTKRKI